MYAAYFGLKENPFKLSPEPAYLYLSRQHRDALNYLIYGIGEKKGFVRPAEYEGVAAHLKDGENVLAVRVSAGGLAEIGTGGLMMPAMIYRASGKPAGEVPKPGDPDKKVYEM